MLMLLLIERYFMYTVDVLIQKVSFLKLIFIFNLLLLLLLVEFWRLQLGIGTWIFAV